MLSKVLLPQPLGPMMLTNSPSPTVSSMLSNTICLRPSTVKDLLMDSTWILGGAPTSLAISAVARPQAMS